MTLQLYTLDVTPLTAAALVKNQETLCALENGKVVYLPHYCFAIADPAERELLSVTILGKHQKNISFDFLKQRLNGFNPDLTADTKTRLQAFMQRYAEYAKQLIATLFPDYQQALRWGRTSYRPAEIKGRASSKRKDDTRLHVDSFPATPVNGQRILRVFCNINPEAKPRVWLLGEPYPTVFVRFAPHLPSYSVAKAKLLALLRITKTLRSAYDHYQLHLHDAMKLSDSYQHSVPKQQVDFAAQSSWVVFTDQVSHAALRGQFLLEQTFYLPVNAMANPTLSPLYYWQQARGEVVAVY